MTRRQSWKIAIIGAGRVGTVLGRLLVDRGDRIVCIVSRTAASARRAGRFLGCRSVSTTLDAIPPDTDLVFITTPHAAIAGVAEGLAGLAGLRFRGMAVCHASGMLTADVLEPVRKRGAKVFSFHPLQTFPRDFPPTAIVKNARGIAYGVDGSRSALDVAHSLARRLGGTILIVPPDRRDQYHAACVVASNHLTAMMSVLSGMFGSLGKSEADFFPVFEPIIMATLRNIARTGPAAALSGPVARGGIETVDGHFLAVRRTTPEFFPYFAAMTLETIRLAIAKGSINESQAQQMIGLVLTHVRDHSHVEEKL